MHVFGIHPFNNYNSSMRKVKLYHYSTNKETGIQQLSHMPKATQLVGRRTKTQTLVFEIPS